MRLLVLVHDRSDVIPSSSKRSETPDLLRDVGIVGFLWLIQQRLNANGDESNVVWIIKVTRRRQQLRILRREMNCQSQVKELRQCPIE